MKTASQILAQLSKPDNCLETLANLTEAEARQFMDINKAMLGLYRSKGLNTSLIFTAYVMGLHMGAKIKEEGFETHEDLTETVEVAN